MSYGWTIEVPESLGDKSLVSFFRGWNWLDDPPGPVTLDFSRTTFIAPWAATLFTSYALWLREVRNKTVRVWVDESTDAGRFLIRSGAHHLIAGLPSEVSPPANDRVAPLTRIFRADDIPMFVTAAMQVLAISDEEMAGAVNYAIVELLRNVVQHARSRIGGLALATFFPTAGVVELVVADIGCGVRTSLRERYTEATTDFKAVKFAVQPHVSSTFSAGEYRSMLNNAGLGLFFIKEIVGRGGGGFFLASGKALGRFWGNTNGTDDKLYAESVTGGWRGTFAVVQLRRDMINDFGSLLERCREIAAAVRKDPTELKLDFISDIPEIEGLNVVRVKAFEENVDAAADVREQRIIPALERGEIVVLDFEGIRFATQSFAHACMYRILRDVPNAVTGLTIARATKPTREAIRAVAAYASIDGTGPPTA